LEENLRQRVFAILTDLANGFAARPENGIRDGDLEILYQNCLIYLYRLLFVLYAEGRDLLPVNRPDRKYRNDQNANGCILPYHPLGEGKLKRLGKAVTWTAPGLVTADAPDRWMKAIRARTQVPVVVGTSGRSS
jgi:hypothetical protein